jgi:(p)ppGpp synthase/HD superfamily hydrolase
VASLVIEHGGSRDQAIAALLHDSIEDQGENYPGGAGALRARIRADFGAGVLEIVEGCTDSERVPKPPWREREETYLVHLRTAPPTVRLVSCADKLHNARAIVQDLHVVGPKFLDVFTGGRDGVLWYYSALAEEFMRGGPQPLAGELDRAVRRMQALVAG